MFDTQFLPILPSFFIELRLTYTFRYKQKHVTHSELILTLSFKTSKQRLH